MLYFQDRKERLEILPITKGKIKLQHKIEND